jgi:hypothetical protein
MSIENNSYRNFDLAIYISDFDIVRVEDDQWLEGCFEVISKNIKIGKVYVETFRDGTTFEKKYVEKAIEFFRSKGVRQLSGGIMANASSIGVKKGRSFCFTDPAEREEFRQVVAYTASMFDEIMFDDLLFFNCRCDKCIKAKGTLSWTEYRLKTMESVYNDLIIKTAKTINPKINLIIKYPNWYEHYQYTGYNLEAGPRIFDQYYTGSETRDSDNTGQFLQIYQSYNIMRYFEHIRPNKFGGGWVDPGRPGTWNRYTQQFDLTLFAKPKEITIWAFGLLVDYIKGENQEEKILGLKASLAGDTCEKVDSFLGELGNPYGIACYKPLHSSGETFIQNFLGMLGIPIDLYSEFPTEQCVIFLAEQASYDPEIVYKIKKHIANGKTIVITSQLYKALLNRGIKELVELTYIDKKVLVDKFAVNKNYVETFSTSTIPILFNQMDIADGFEPIQCIAGSYRFPLLIGIPGLDNGHFYVLNIPENIGDLYNLPMEVLSEIRQVLMPDILVTLECPAQNSLFVYDNDTFIVQSYLRSTNICSLVVKKPNCKLINIMTDQCIAGDYTKGNKTFFELNLEPNSYKVFKIQS